MPPNEPATPGTFKPGDRVRCVTIMHALGFTIKQGDLGTVAEAVPGSCPRILWDGKPPPDRFPGWGCATSSIELLKPAPAPVEMWVSQPKDDELPKTLPAGTRAKNDICEAYSLGAVTRSSDYYHGQWKVTYTTGRVVSGGDGFPVCAILWTTVPRPSQKAVPAQAERCGCDGIEPSGCPSCKTTSTQPPEPGQSPPDPYAGYDLSAWGIPGVNRAPRAARAPQCRECGQETTHQGFDGEPHCADCQCMVATAILGSGPANEPLDRRIAAARHSTEREAGAKRFDAWVSVRHAREAK